MNERIPRREALKLIGAAGTAVAASGARAAAMQDRPIVVAGRPREISVESVSAMTARITLRAIGDGGETLPVPLDGSLVRESWGPPVARFRSLAREERVAAGGLTVVIAPDPLSIRVEDSGGRIVQRLSFEADRAPMNFHLGEGPLLGLGQGGPQFDRRGSVDAMRNGQGGYRLRTHGGRAPIPWLIGAAGGWAIFIHQPYGSFDFTGEEGRLDPLGAGGGRRGRPGGEPAPPASPDAYDVFVVGAREPAAILAEYARLTGLPEMPPLWSFGYQQSHRTLADRAEVVGVARTFREKKLPCDALIYLGTGFCPSGWNVDNGTFEWNASVFDDPKAVLDELHAMNFKVVLHDVIRTRRLEGSVTDNFDSANPNPERAADYWWMHREINALGVDGWWPDMGDALDPTSRLTRHRMFWEGMRLTRPGARAYALHRNGYAGMQRFAAFLWSGDVHTTWETLATHVPVAVNTGLTGIPYWGTDIGGFVPTAEYTGELHVRWFQFGAFCPLFRAHGRSWHLRLPWGWSTGELGHDEIVNYTGGAANPDPSELRNPEVEPICKQYLELRYRLMPYLYSAVRECCETGLPIMRALWLHYPDDPIAVARGDEYLWGRDILVAPVVERGATSRRLYLPRGDWFDFWTDERVAGGREIERAVDLATTPLYVRAGAIVPTGPVKQHVDEAVDGPLTLTVYPGADGAFTVFEDDGRTTNHRDGDWMGIEARWDDAERALRLSLANGSRMRPPAPRRIAARVTSRGESRIVEFNGEPIEIQL